jgi:hypothetical protein
MSILDSNINSDIQPVHLFKNEKILLMTVPKIAHSWCKKIFLDDKNIDSEFQININDFNIQKTNKLNSDNYDEEIINIWISLLDGNCKKDLIILYRNPIEHFISAFVQDWFTNDINNNIQYFNFFLESLSISPAIKNDFLEEYLTSSKLSEKLIKKYPNIISEIIKVTLDYHLNRSQIEKGHYTLWLSFLNKLINSKKIDNLKIKLIDIYDNQLENQLQKYITFNNKLPYQSRLSFSHKFIKKIIKETTRFNIIIDTILKYEIIYYNEMNKKQLI